MTTMMHRTSQIDDAMEAMRAGRGKGGRATCHEGHGGCGRKQHGLKEQRMWAGSEVGGDSSAGRQRAPVSASMCLQKRPLLQGRQGRRRRPRRFYDLLHPCSR
ncbi:hypothetical protein VPH35_051592 [Triticum aestivum]